MLLCLQQKENLKVTWMNHDGYKEYTQPYPPFVHGVTILGMPFNAGPGAKYFMRTF